jgi:hypothetical protein
MLQLVMSLLALIILLLLLLLPLLLQHVCTAQGWPGAARRDAA